MSGIGVNLWEWIKGIGFSGFLDIAFMTLLLYSILVWMKRTKRAAAVLTGILIVAAVYLAARQFNLLLTAAILQGFFAVILIALIVIFQEELRYFFEQVAHWSLDRRIPLFGRAAASLPRQQVRILVRTLQDLARERIGALVVIRGRDILAGHLHGGTYLNGQISEEILKSIFDHHSAGHDGAVVVEEGRISSFACHLPLSTQFQKLGHGGTRHAAALGLSERTDALCIVVSEERGTISAARHGEIGQVKDADSLTRLLEALQGEATADKPREERSIREFFRRNQREKFMAFGMSLLLWFVLVHESGTVYRTYTIAVNYPQPAQGLEVTGIEPEEVQVTFSGARKTFYFLGKNDIQLMLKPWDLKEGKRAIQITSSDLIYPNSLSLENFEPRQVSVSVAESGSGRNQKK